MIMYLALNSRILVILARYENLQKKLINFIYGRRRKTHSNQH